MWAYLKHQGVLLQRLLKPVVYLHPTLDQEDKAKNKKPTPEGVGFNYQRLA